MEMFNKSQGYKVSPKYAVINTGDLVSRFEAQGFQLERVSKARVKNADKQGYQKHLMVFRHASMSLKGVNDSVPEILLKNSYDGTSSFELMLGIYRMVCANGLVVGSTFGVSRVKHVGNNAVDKAIQAAFDVATQVDLAASRIESMQSIILSHVEQLQFATQAADLIRPDNVVQFDSSKLLTARRGPDTGSDLWTVFNRVQENIIRGGLHYKTVDVQGRVKNATKRAVKSIDRNIEINKALWTVAEQFIGA